MAGTILRIIFITGLLLSSGACSTKHAIEVAPVETRHVVEPIHITIDINVRIDRDLDDFFGDLDKAEEKL
ncbi:MAG: hypothetical protein JXL81_08955 [Deltaproteobacteria bacterium]|nr:hypothetical protein [Deltaproteobacteria bacterium]